MNKKDILDFIKRHHIMYLSTINEFGFPECRALINIMHGDIAPHLCEFMKKNEKIYMITNTHTAKINQIKNNPKSSLYITDNQNFNGLLLVGNVNEVMDYELKKSLWHDSWTMYYPAGLDGRDFSVLEFTPENYKFYSNFSVKKDKVEW